MADLQKKYFVGQDRRKPWSLEKITPGQFITFLYKSQKKNSRTRRRYILVLSEKFIPKQMQKSPSPKRTYMISGLDFGMFGNKNQQLYELFRKKRLSTDVNIVDIDNEGFRYFGVNIIDEKKTYNKLKPIVEKNKKDSIYKTFDYNKLKKSSIELYNPKFPIDVLNNMSILNEDLWE